MDIESMTIDELKEEIIRMIQEIDDIQILEENLSFYQESCAIGRK